MVYQISYQQICNQLEKGYRSVHELLFVEGEKHLNFTKFSLRKRFLWDSTSNSDFLGLLDHCSGFCLNKILKGEKNY